MSYKMVHGQMNTHCWDTQIFKLQQGQSLYRGYLAKYYINQGPIFDWMVTGLRFGYKNMKYVVCIIYCFIKTEAQIPWYICRASNGLIWRMLTVKYFNADNAIGKFCPLKNSKTNVNILLDFSQLLEERKCVAV